MGQSGTIVPKSRYFEPLAKMIALMKLRWAEGKLPSAKISPRALEDCSHVKTLKLKGI